MPAAKSLRVLVVDDQESVRGIMRGYVKRLGVDNVDVAESGSAALKPVLVDVLLVVGHGKDGSEDEIWKRSIENIALAVPVAARYGIQIVIENVWNHFLYNHEGDHTQTAEKYVRYVDELNSPWVGMQFDIGNHWKYGSMGDWIRTLGRRVMKLDIKGFSRKDSKFTRISEGDIDYADVRKALREIQFYGWVAAEVGGGDAAELKRISGELDVAFGLV